MKAVIW